MRYRFLVTLTLTPLLLTGCSLFDGSSQPQPEPTSAIAPPLTPTSLPPTPGPGDSISLSWTQKPVQPHQTEADRPFQELVKTNASAGSDLWRVYTVTGDAAPRLERESRRWIRNAAWLDNGAALLLSYTTNYGPQDFASGAEKLIPGAGRPVWDLRLPSIAHAVSPSGEFALIERGNALLLRSDGTLWEAQTDLPLQNGAWSPDGRRLILISEPRTGPGANLQHNFIVEPLGHTATLAGHGYYPLWSPGSSSVVLMTNSSGDTDVSVFDVTSRRTETFPIKGFALSNYPFSWSPDGRYFTWRDGLLDFETGTVVRQPSGQEIIDAAVSPDGRSLLLTLEVSQDVGPNCGQGKVLNRTLLVDIVSGAQRTLFDCNRLWTYVEWVDSQRFLAYTHTCWSCEGRSRLFLLDVDGSEKQLTDEFRAFIRYDVSPDGSKILVSGDELRLYTNTGVLLRSIPVEPGFSVIDVNWSPDGNSFVYIVGPQDLVVI